MQRQAEGALRLGAVDVQGDDPVDAGGAKQAAEPLRAETAAGIAPVLPGVGEIGDERSDALRSVRLKGVRQLQERRQAGVGRRDRADQHRVSAAAGRAEFVEQFAVHEPSSGRAAESGAAVARDLARQRVVFGLGEEDHNGASFIIVRTSSSLTCGNES